MNFLQNQADPALPELKERLRNQFQFFGDDMLMTGSIGEWAAPLGAGAVWRDAQRLVAQAGWRNENSVQNLAGLQQVVEAYEAVQQGVRHQAAALDGAPRARGQRRPAHAPEGDGLRRADGRVPLGDVVRSEGGGRPAVPHHRRHGIQVGIHGDGVHIAPLNPWPHIDYAVTGVNSFGAKVNGDQQLTRAEALRLFTRGNSWFLRMEDKIGSIETGKLADLVVLDRDYFTVPEVQIKQIRSVLTIVDGKVVHGLSSDCA